MAAVGHGFRSFVYHSRVSLRGGWAIVQAVLAPFAEAGGLASTPHADSAPLLICNKGLN